MKKAVAIAVAGLLQSISIIEAQVTASPFTIKYSEPFVVPKGHTGLDPIAFGKDGYIQVSSKEVESFSFQKFSKDLKLEQEKLLKMEEVFGERVNMERFIRLKNKTFLFARVVDREKDREGVSALEFSPQNLDFIGKPVSLFQSSYKVRTDMVAGAMPMFYGFGGSVVAYDFCKSQDSSKFMYNYALVPKERNSKINKDVIGMYIYDENLTKLWGSEYQMPYTEAVMDNLSYTISNDGKVYILIRVNDIENKKALKKAGEISYRYEILIYQKGNPNPKIVELKLDNYFPTEAYMYEDANHNIVVTGFYSKDVKELYVADGFYMVKLDVEKSAITKVNSGYYEIPSEVIKEYMSERNKKKLDKKEKKDGDIGLEYLSIRNIYSTPNGAIKIIAEIYRQYTYTSVDSKGRMTTNYATDAKDIFVISIDNTGKMEWIKKIPKSQNCSNWVAPGSSINSFVTGNDLNIFYLENLKNNKLPVEKKKTYWDGDVGMVKAITIDANGNVTSYSLTSTKEFKTRFYVRYFKNGGNHNLIHMQRKKKKDILFSIETKK
jgi:hypothetical protein